MRRWQWSSPGYVRQPVSAGVEGTMLAREIAAATSRSGLSGGLAPLTRRLASWWPGLDRGASTRFGPAPGAGDLVSFRSSGDRQAAWSAARIEAMHLIWGAGFTVPGGERYARKLLGALTLSSKKSVLDLFAGTGGTARALARQHKLRMDAIEPIAELAAEGQSLSAAQGLGKRVAITPIDATHFELTPQRYDAIYSRERLFAEPGKERILDQCTAGLKDKGQLLITDLVATREDEASIDTAALRRDGEEPDFWTVERYRDELEARRFLIFLAQDLTAEYLDQIHSAWARAMECLAQTRPDRTQRDLIIEEGKVWLARWLALEAGKIAFVRIYAQNGGST